MLAASFGIVSSARLSRARPNYVDTFDCPATLATALMQCLAALRGVNWDNFLLLLVATSSLSRLGVHSWVRSICGLNDHHDHDDEHILCKSVNVWCLESGSCMWSV